jgi:hypothetical protein
MMLQKLARVVAGVILGSMLALGTASCGDAPPPPPPKKNDIPQWADVFEGTPDVFAVVRPKQLKGDAVYGNFWKSLLRVASARGFTRGQTMVEAFEGSDEVIIGLNKGEAALVLRGVPANLDPAKVNDASGQPLFRAVSNDRAKVQEFELNDRRLEQPSAVFVLPDRTWVGTLGETRNRARQVFAHPVNKPKPEGDNQALAFIRFGGPVAHMLDRHPTYGVFAKKLNNVTFSLKPGKSGLVIALAYDEADATAYGEMQGKRWVAEMAQKDQQRFGWLKDAKVQYEGNVVFIRAPVPPRLLEELPNASGSDFGL